MAVLTATNQGGGVPLEAGRYSARITGIEPWEQRPDSKFKKTEPEERLTLRVRGETRDDGGPLEIHAWITLYPNPGKRSQVYKLWSAIFFAGKELPEGEPIDTDQLLNCNVDILVGPKKEGEGNTITGFLPPTPVPARATTAAAATRRQRVTADDIDDV